MAERSSGPSDELIAIQLQEKFQLYLVSLVFTLLALSIQSAKLGTYRHLDYIELAGWLALLISGIAGLWHIEYAPVIRTKGAMQHRFENEILEYKRIQQTQNQTHVWVVETASNDSIADIIKNRQDAVDVLRPFIARLERHAAWKYQTHRWAFVAGVVLVIASRAGAVFVK